MNPAMTHPAHRARRALVTSLAALLTASFATGQTTDESLRRLQEENATLRKRLAEVETRSAPASAATSTRNVPTAAQVGSAPANSTESSDVQLMSPFEVNTSKDFGYL